jgi:hypothetical protein
MGSYDEIRTPTMKSLKLSLTLFLLALVAMPAFALEEAAPDTPAGIGWLFLLLGIGAIVIIGFVMFARERAGDIDGEAQPKA